MRDIKVKTDKDFIWNDNERIVGGLEALLHQAPYQVYCDRSSTFANVRNCWRKFSARDVHIFLGCPVV